jgi:hypothetical protein
VKLSTKIIFGFVLTNVIYLLLLAAIFIIVRPLTLASVSQKALPMDENFDF